jgi:hypothetical protein
MRRVLQSQLTRTSSWLALRAESSPFHIALLEQNLRIIAHANLRSRMQWPASFNCQRTMSRCISSGLSAPGGAARGRETGVAENKKPGVKRRAIPSTHLGGRICSKLDCCLSGVRNQPHLCLEGKFTGQSGPPSAPLGLPTSGKYTDFPVFVK